jgi:hypothetical protein
MKQIRFLLECGECPKTHYGKILADAINEKLQQGMPFEEYPRFPVRNLVNEVDNIFPDENYEIVIKVMRK